MQYHVLDILAQPNQRYELRLSVCSYNVINPAGVHAVHTLGRQAVANFDQRGNRLKFQILDGQLADVRLNDSRCTRLLDQQNRQLKPTEVNSEGSFGTFNTHSAGTFLLPAINGRQVRLLKP